MMDLSTHYMGIDIASPIVAGASPLSSDYDAARRLEDAGAAALVMHSLFEEQITADELSLHHHTSVYDMAHPEAESYFPEPEAFTLAPDSYLEHLRRLKEGLSIPIIASLNGVTMGGWVHYANLMQEAGADGLELNVYYVANSPEESPRDVEQRYLDVLAAIKEKVTIPIAMKLSPFFSAPVYMAKQLDAAGVNALVLFNRFYQPDIDIDTLQVAPVIHLSDSEALLLRLRWLAAIYGHVACSLGATGGVHTGHDVIKALMSGASAVQMASALLQNGPDYLKLVHQEVVQWMTDNEYVSVTQMCGSMSLSTCPEPAAFERANYMKVLQSWQLGRAV